MRAALVTQQGDPVAPNVRLVEDHPDPVPGPGAVLVRTEAAALNQLDLWIGRGVPGLDLEYPRVTGSDACGVVEAVGDGGDPAWVGRRVMLNAAVPTSRPPRPGETPGLPELRMIGEHDPGCMAERFVAPAANVLTLSDDTDPVAAAAFGLVHLTAWRMLVTQAGLRHGQTALITGIGGGVALAALGICRHFGCPTVVTSRHQSKLDRALALGADHAVLDTGADWSRAVRAWSGKVGVDVCVDSIGAAVHESCIRSLRPGGTFVTCGTSAGAEATINLARMFWFQLRLVGSTMGDMREFHEVVALFRSGALAPVVDSVHDASDAVAAYTRLETGDQFGKVVVRWS
jgi:NADPH:quinone reductase-like Zn-dependent oxidoreductase